jgi:hypothetical protein
MEAAVFRAGQHDGCVADEGGFEGAGPGHLDFQANIVPGAPTKDALLLERIDIGVGIYPIRRTPIPLFRP